MSGTLVCVWSCGLGGRSEMAESANFEVGDRFSSYREPERVHIRAEVAKCKAELMY